MKTIPSLTQIRPGVSFIVTLALIIFLPVYSVAQSSSVTFTNSGSYTIPANVCQVTIEAWGSGAAGGNNNANSFDGGGGGGGAYFKWTALVNTGDVFNFTIGKGPCFDDNPAQSGDNGTNGQATTVTVPGGVLTAGGGFAGRGGNAMPSCAGGPGGLVSSVPAGMSFATSTTGNTGGNGSAAGGGAGAAAIGGATGAGAGGRGGGGLATDCDGAPFKGNDGKVVITVSNLTFTASADTTICFQDSAQLKAISTTSNKYKWTPSTGLNCDTCSNPKASPATTTDYTVTVTNGLCVQSKTIRVQVNKSNAGLDDSLTLCDIGDKIDLFTKTIDAPAGGIWVGPDGKRFINPFNPAIDKAGVYLYLVSEHGCKKDTAFMTVKKVHYLSAGKDGKDTLCNTVSDFNLFNLITTEDAGGTWKALNAPPSSVNPTTGKINATTLLPNAYNFIYVQVSGDPCPNDTSIVSVYIKALPTVTIPTPAPFCSGTTAYLKPQFTGSGPWTMTYVDCDGNSATLSGLKNGDSIAISPTTSPCSYTVTNLSDAGKYSCTNTAQSTVAVTLLNAPVIQLDSLVCNSTNDRYTAFCTLNGGDNVSYQINNSTNGISANKFKSDPLPQGSPYNFVVKDKNGCGPVSSLDGVKNCDCSTYAGTMQKSLIDVCGLTPALGTHNNDHIFDGNDTLNFILHDKSGASLGKIISINPLTPEFTYDPAWNIKYNQTYYISAVAGNKKSGNTSSVDLANGGGCLSVSAGQPVQFHEIPAVTPSVGITQLCFGDSIRIDFSFTAGKELFSIDYSVNGSSGSKISNLSPVKNFCYVTPPLLGLNTYTFTAIKDHYGCSASMNMAINLTTVDFPVASPEVKTCNSTNSAYTVSFNISMGDKTSYEINGTSLGGSTTFTSAPISSGTGYSFLLTDASNCKPVTISGSNTCPCTSKAGTMSQPSGVPKDFCLSATATAAHNGDQVFDGNDTLSFILCSDSTNPFNTAIFRTKTPNYNFQSPLVAGSIYYIFPIVGDTDPSGLVNLNSSCIDIGTGIPIRFIAPPTISMTGNKEICQGDSALLTFNITGNGNIKFTLNGNDGSSQLLNFNAGIRNTTVKPTISKGVVIYSIDPSSIFDATQPNSCAGTYIKPDVVVTVHPTPTAAISGNFTICQGEAIALPIITTGDNTLTTTWGLTSGQAIDSSFTAAAGNHNKQITSSLSAGTYTYVIKSIEDKSVAGCKGTFSGQSTILVQARPTASMAMVDDTICRNDSSQIRFLITGNQPFSIYYHDNTNQNFQHTNLPVGTSNFIVKPTQSRTYTLDSISDGTSSNASNRSCFRKYTSANKADLTVIQLPTGALSGSTEICSGDSTWIRFNLNGAFALSATYNIRNEESGSNSLQTLSTLKTQDSVRVSPADTTTYSLIKIVDRYGCKATNFGGIAYIPVNPNPIPIVATSDSSSCVPLSTKLINLTDPKYLGQFNWDFGDGTTASGTGMDTGFQKTYTLPKSYTIRLEVTTPQGCYKDTLLPDFLVAHPFPKAEFSWNPLSPDINFTTIQFNNLSEGQETNSWKFYTSSGVLLNSSSKNEPSYTFPDQDSGTYRIDLLVSSDFGCQDSINHEIQIKGIFDVYVPNTFSPNADGDNDEFLPVMIGEAPHTYELSIYNRWGELIFFSTNYREAWNGTYKGELLKEDQYIFYLKIKSKYKMEFKDIKGTVGIIR